MCEERKREVSTTGSNDSWIAQQHMPSDRPAPSKKHAAIQQFLKAQQALIEEITRQEHGVVSSILENTKAKVREVDEFKIEVRRDAAEIVQSMKSLKLKIEARTKSDTNQDGIIISKASTTLKFDHGKLMAEIEASVAYWENELEQLKSQTTSITEEIKSSMLGAELKLTALL